MHALVLFHPCMRPYPSTHACARIRPPLRAPVSVRPCVRPYPPIHSPIHSSTRTSFQAPAWLPMHPHVHPCIRPPTWNVEVGVRPPRPHPTATPHPAMPATPHPAMPATPPSCHACHTPSCHACHTPILPCLPHPILPCLYIPLNRLFTASPNRIQPPTLAGRRRWRSCFELSRAAMRRLRSCSRETQCMHTSAGWWSTTPRCECVDRVYLCVGGPGLAGSRACKG
eukprot:363351-Chlamydomonas_euryale.AAC.10